MSLSTCPAATLANMRNPSDIDLKPTEISSSSSEGRSKQTDTTSIANWFCTFALTLPTPNISDTLRIITERRIVETISTIPVASTQDRDINSEILSNTAIRQDRFPTMVDMYLREDNLGLGRYYPTFAHRMPISAIRPLWVRMTSKTSELWI